MNGGKIREFKLALVFLAFSLPLKRGRRNALTATGWGRQH
jgi:hypothetical protein